MQSSLANRAGSGPERIAVVVTHGVGEAEPGDCVRGLVATLLRRKGVHVAETTEVGWLDDEPAPVGGAAPAPAGAAAALVSDAAGEATPPRPCRKFPVSFHAVTINGRQHLTFADVYWADLTRVGTGRVSALLGLFRVIFEAHYVIDAMLDPKRGFAERSLRAILLC